GVPARIAGTALWANLRGNHTWVEVWDGEWHFTGAAEPDPRGLDRGWFVHDASQAKRDDPRHAIWASSWKRTGESFPLVFARRIDWVPAVNVTDRYASEKKEPETKARLLIDVLAEIGGPRIASTVELVDADDPDKVLRGRSRDPSNDTNDILAFEVDPDKRYEVRILDGDRVIVRKEYRCEGPGEAHLRLPLSRLSERAAPSRDRDSDPAPDAESPPASATEKEAAAEPKSTPATDESTGEEASPRTVDAERERVEPSPASAAEVSTAEPIEELRAVVRAYLAASSEERAKLAIPESADRLLAAHEDEARALVWDEYRKSPAHAELEEDFKARRVRAGGRESPYTLKDVGERGENGWALVIAMHGGGGVPKRVNDQQWRVMQGYYRDQSGVPGYRYVALRAPTDEWNGFYTDYAYPVIAELVRQFLVFGDVDPNRVYILGYSHGGYGAFAIGMTMPDRFAAVHASAAAPTESEGSARNLRHTPFTYMIGERDLAYGRLERCRAFDGLIAKIRAEETDEKVYPVVLEYQAGFGHGGLPDRDKIRDMIPHVRNAVPRDLTWDVTSPKVRHHFWLEAPGEAEGGSIDARIEDGKRIVVTTKKLERAVIWLDRRLVRSDGSIALVVNGKERKVEVAPSFRAFLESLVARGDPQLAFTTRIELDLEETSPTE
ncbi:MAG TPA: hypothetical protein VK116_13185, partial [Planctomycetota bacterium]|nr:hypothetical protein [Planctomycetota bacterium]